MIHLPLKERDAPPDRLSVAGALRQIRRAVNEADGENYNHSYYPHDLVTDLLRAYSIHKRVLGRRDKPKCNYCESQIEKAVTLQVEHYLPKAKVEAGENDHVELPGYYWLGLEWTNLLLSCPKCNGKEGKGNKFPIRGIRAVAINPVSMVNNIFTLDRTGCYADADPLLAELPILLNPEIDHPENFLTFNRYGIIREHGADPERGRISKETYNLNRSPLVIARADVWEEFGRRITVDIGGHSLTRELNDDALHFRFKAISRDILKRKQPEQEFTLWGRHINAHIDEFIDHYIDAAYRPRFKNAYVAVLAEQQQLQPVI